VEHGNPPGKPCKHLLGDKPGEHACALHDKPWYSETPCYQHGQIETTDSPCRMGEYQLKLNCTSKENNTTNTMDPDACFERYIGAVVDGDTLEAFYAINDLSDWYLKGGFPAKFPGGETPIPAKFVHELVVTFKLACDKLGLEI
jgi:hypothetical protein